MRKGRRNILPALLILLLQLVFVPFAKADELIIESNSSDSVNAINVQLQTQTSYDQVSSGSSESSVKEESVTGENTLSENTNGTDTVTTGDALNIIQAETSLNTSTQDVECCVGESGVIISENGSGSQNTANLSQTSSQNITISQNVTIVNNISGYANTGGNSTDLNTNGNTQITTGNINIKAQLINSPINTSTASVWVANSDVSLKITDNGKASINTINEESNNNTLVVSDFNAYIKNYVYWNANSGKNSASGNSGGTVTIKTGDIDINVFIKNLANLGGINLECCVFDPGNNEDEPKPEDGQVEEKEKNEDENKVEGGGILLPEAAATEAGGPGIFGLSDTGSQKAQFLYFILGLSLIVLGEALRFKKTQI